MTLLSALLCLAHGVILYRRWGKFRPHMALLHGVGLAAFGFGLGWLGLPVWAPGLAGLAVGAVGALGHRLVPGLFPGGALLLVLDPTSVPFVLGAQLGAALTVFAKR